MSAVKVIIDGVEFRPHYPDVALDHKFHDLMRVHRKGFGWTLEEAAKQIGCAKSHLHGMESGTVEPSLKMAYKIQQAYDLSMKRQVLALLKHESTK